MSTKKTFATLFAAVSLLSLVGASAADAQYVVEYRNAPVFVQPQVIVRPMRTTTVQRTYYTPAPVQSMSRLEILTQPAVITPRVTTSTITNSALLSSTLSAMSDYRARLDNISQQISMGESRGWLNSATASSLQAEYRGLSARADMLMSPGEGNSASTDMLEKDINVLNQNVTDLMSRVSL